ncbi:HET domain-containing protein [Cladorrhinum sp. PSN259]|nr:HET domain-containing protein [Cladorrhinum sp. PSN259]
MEYQYLPLPPLPEHGRSPPYTRILRLEPAVDQHEPLRAVLEPADVSATAPYEALSYTWGTDPPSDYLWLGNTPLPIKPNLEAALRALRLPDLFRRLWVDAVCIDQSNVDERSRQVEYMRLVYQHSTRVIVWLGARTPGVEQAFDAASRLSQVIESLNEAGGGNGFDGLDPEAVEAFTESMSGDLPPTAMHHLGELFDRPYWTRTWCIQEVVAAPWAVVRVDDLEISFPDLMSTATWVNEWRGKVAIDKTLILWYTVYLQRHPRRPVKPSNVPGSLGDLLGVMESARGFQATDIRDKVFAMFGICDEGLQPELALTQVEGPANSGLTIRALRKAISKINDFAQRHGPDPNFGTPRALRPNYRKDAVDVYTDMTRFLIRKQPRKLDVLGHVQHNVDPSPTDEYPSWVPKWFEPTSCFVMRACFLAGFCNGHFRYFAELHDMPMVREPVRPKVLSLDGFHVDVVDKVSNVMEFGFSDDQRTVAVIEGLWTQLFPFPMFATESPSYISGEPLEVAFCNALAASPLGFVAGSAVRNLLRGRWGNMIPDKAAQEGKIEDAMMQMCQDEIASFLAHLQQRRNNLNAAAQSGSPAASTPYEGTDSFIHFLGGVRMFSLNRRVFVTRSGRFGIGPRVTRPGDEVVVLFGGRLPYILRRLPDHHVFLGASYVHDQPLMWGNETEKVRFNKPGAAARVTYELR